MSRRFAQVAQQVPTIGNLNGLRSSAAGGFGVDATAVAADDLGTGMLWQPRSYCVGVAIGKQVDYPAGLQVTGSFHTDVPCARPSRRCRVRVALALVTGNC